jgi:hypothetical protein
LNAMHAVEVAVVEKQLAAQHAEAVELLAPLRAFAALREKLLSKAESIERGGCTYQEVRVLLLSRHAAPNTPLPTALPCFAMRACAAVRSNAVLFTPTLTSVLLSHSLDRPCSSITPASRRSYPR